MQLRSGPPTQSCPDCGGKMAFGKCSKCGYSSAGKKAPPAKEKGGKKKPPPKR